MPYDDNYQYDNGELGQDEIVRKYMLAKMSGQVSPEERARAAEMRSQNQQLEEQATQANLMAGLNNASALISGGRYKADNSDLMESNKDRGQQLAQNSQQLAQGEAIRSKERSAAIEEYLKGMRVEKKTPSERPQEYLGKDGKPKIGRYIEGAGLTMADNDPYAYVKPDKSPKDETSKNARDLANDWDKHPETKNTRMLQTAYGKMQNADNSAPGDMSLIYGFMKMQDPNSTVREGEYASAENARGVESSIMNLYNKIRTGARLTPEQRTQFKLQAKGIYDAQLATQGQVDSRFTDLAKINGVDPHNLLITNWGKETPIAKVPPIRGGGDGTALAAPIRQAPSGTITMTNKKTGETLHVQQGDVSAAKSEGFEEAQ